MTTEGKSVDPIKFRLFIDSDGKLSHAVPAIARTDQSIAGWITKNRLVTLLDPITAATVATWLAQGAVAYVGGMAMGAILGHPSLSDIAKLIQEGFAELRAFIRDELRLQLKDQDFLEMRASMKSVIENLSDYNLVPVGSRQSYAYMVNDAYIQSGNVMARASEYGINGITLYASAASLRLMAIVGQRSYRPISEIQEIANRNVNAATLRISELVGVYGETWNPEKRVGPVIMGPWSGWDGTYQPVPMSYWCPLDGVYIEHSVRHSGSGDPAGAGAQAFRESLIARAREDSEQKVAVIAAPMSEVLRAWPEVAKGLST